MRTTQYQAIELTTDSDTDDTVIDIRPDYRGTRFNYSDDSHLVNQLQQAESTFEQAFSSGRNDLRLTTRNICLIGAGTNSALFFMLLFMMEKSENKQPGEALADNLILGIVGGMSLLFLLVYYFRRIYERERFEFEFIDPINQNEIKESIENLLTISVFNNLPSHALDQACLIEKKRVAAEKKYKSAQSEGFHFLRIKHRIPALVQDSISQLVLEHLGSPNQSTGLRFFEVSQKRGIHKALSTDKTRRVILDYIGSSNVADDMVAEVRFNVR